MAGEGEVIACHKIQEWNEHIMKANESKKLIVIDFTASWCPPCRFIAPVFAEFARKFGSNAFFFKIDVDELAEIAQEFQVEAMPTFVFMREGQVLEKMVGAQKENLQTTIVKHIGASTAAA